MRMTTRPLTRSDNDSQRLSRADAACLCEGFRVSKILVAASVLVTAR